MVHQIYLSKNTDRAATQGVNMTGKLESFRIDNIDIGGRNGQNNTVWFRNVF
jgi:hypothetical protein